MAWGTEVERERKRRIEISVWAYAYEIDNSPLVSDAVFDTAADLIRPEMPTGHPLLDAFFREHYCAFTGMWVNRHPEKDKLRFLTARYREFALALL